MKKIAFIIALVTIFWGCSQHSGNISKVKRVSDMSSNIQKSSDSRDSIPVSIDFVNFTIAPTGDSIVAEVKLVDKQSGQKVNKNLDINNFAVYEKGMASQDFPRIDTVIDIRGQKIISNEYAILLLVDRSASISEDVLKKQKEAVEAFTKDLSNTDVYISFMDENITPSQLITANRPVDDLQWRVSKSEKFLYNAILAKLEELYALPRVHYPNIRHNPDFADTSKKKMLFVLTDGKVKDGNSFIGSSDFFTWKGELVIDLPQKITQKQEATIPIHCIYFGDNSQIVNIQDEMEFICSMGTTNETKGKFYRNFEIDSLKNILLGSIDSIAADYRLVLSNPPGKMYKGENISFQLLAKTSDMIAFGTKNYSLGSPLNVVVVAGEGQSISKWDLIFKGLLIGALTILLVFIIFQYLIPYIRYRIFLKKYVVSYRESNSSTEGLVNQQCYHCKEEFKNGDKVVNKCKHIVHWECWQDNRNRCPEFGSKNCDTGSHYYNKENKSDKKNAPYYLSWMLYGLLGGFLTWLFYKILYTDTLFAGFIESLVNTFYRTNEAIDPLILNQFVSKIQSLLLCGLLLGAFLTFLFSYIVEFKRKDFKTMALICLRAIVGGVFGFLSFLLGSIIIILIGKYANCFWTDWISWLFFGCSIAWLIAFKTEIKIKNALIGGLISVLVSFIVLYLADFAKEIIGMFSFMIYGAGLGVAIAVVHFVSEKYFLRVEGPIKEREIAIYKWMSVSGGFNRVTIGRSIDCVLEMNWDKEGSIADTQVALYIENERPYCEGISDGTLVNGRELRRGQKVNLYHGTEFKIGNTIFTYLEKDK